MLYLIIKKKDMTQTKDFKFVIRLIDDLCDGGIMYYFIHKFERNKDISFNDLKIFLDRFHDDDVDEEYYKQSQIELLEMWNDEQYNKDAFHNSDEYFNEWYEDNFDLNEIKY
jgi:hypothetical protein